MSDRPGLLGNVPVRFKLAIGFAVVLTLAAIGGWVGVSAVSAVGRLAVDLYDRPLQAIDFSRVAQLDLREMFGAQRLASHPDTHMAERAKADYRRARAAFDDDVAVARRRAASPGMRQRLDGVTVLLADWDRMVPPDNVGVPHNERIEALSERILDEIDIAVENAKADGFFFIEDARRQTAEARRTTLLVSVIVVASGVLVATLLTRNIVNPLHAAVRIAERIAGGQLDGEAASRRRDEAGKLLRAMETMRHHLRARVEADRRLMELERERRLNLGRYLPSQISDWLAENPADVVRAGKRQDVAILFTDIRGFTRRAETLDPASLGQFVGEFRQQVAAAADAHGGVIDKFIGDAAMVVFGIPQSHGPEPHGRTAGDALACARALLANIEDWNRGRTAAGQDEVRIGIGVHWGPVFCGAIGDAVRLEYTVLGDTVNVAARLQDETKSAGYPLVVSEAVLAAAGPAEGALSGWQPLPPKSLRGRDGEMVLYGWSAAADTAVPARTA